MLENLLLKIEPLEITAFFFDIFSLSVSLPPGYALDMAYIEKGKTGKNTLPIKLLFLIVRNFSRLESEIFFEFQGCNDPRQRG